MRRKLINALLGLCMVIPSSLISLQAEEAVPEEETITETEEAGEEISETDTSEIEEEEAEKTVEETIENGVFEEVNKATNVSAEEDIVEAEQNETGEEEITIDETVSATEATPEDKNVFSETMQLLEDAEEDLSEGEIIVEEETLIHELNSSSGISSFISFMEENGELDGNEYKYTYWNDKSQLVSIRYNTNNGQISLSGIIPRGGGNDGVVLTFDPSKPNAYLNANLFHLGENYYVIKDQMTLSDISYSPAYDYFDLDTTTYETSETTVSADIKNKCNSLLRDFLNNFEDAVFKNVGIHLYDLNFTNVYSPIITPEKIIVKTGESTEVDITTYPASAIYGNITWSYPNALISVEGSETHFTVSGIAEGNDTVTVTLANGASVTADVEVNKTEEEPVWFEDVTDPTKSYYEAVYWAVDEGITKGTSPTMFSPLDPCTRGQFVTFLWRAEGCPEPDTTNNPFTDVQSDKSYYKAVLWALENKITTGTSATKFSPGKPCTRGQLVTFLYRVAGTPEAKGGKIFSDVKSGLSYSNAVNWAADKKITTGTDATHFSPDKTCTRSQCVTFLMRMFRDSFNLYRGWTKVKGKWKYLDENDEYVTGWKDILNSRYYFNASGEMVTGWQKSLNGTYYLSDYEDHFYFNADGQMAKGFQTINKKKYYFDNDGVMQTEWLTVGNKKYYFGEDGIMRTGWQQIYDYYDQEMVWYYFDASGVMAKGWKKLNNKWYYFNDYMYYSGWYEIDGYRYYFKDDGEMITGWGQYSGDYGETYWAYCNPDGKAHTGWVKSGGDWYYVDEGDMYIGLNYIDGILYGFTNDGKMVRNTFYRPYAFDKSRFNSAYPYHFDANGKGTNGWVREASGREIYYENGKGQFARYRY